MRLTSSDLQALGFNLDGTRIQPRPPGEPSKAVARESDLHESILSICRARRWLVVHSRMDIAQTASVGVPDFVVALPAGRVVWVECKSATGKLRHEQAAWLAALRSLGHTAEVVRSLPEFLAIVTNTSTE